MLNLKKLIRTFLIIFSTILSGYLLLQVISNPVFAGSQSVATLAKGTGAVTVSFALQRISPSDRDSSRGSSRVFRLLAVHTITGAVPPDFGGT